MAANLLYAAGILIGILLIGGALLGLAYSLANKFFGVVGFRKKKLLTANEVDFYFKLQSAVGSEWVILAQVSMGALMDTTLKPNHPQFWKARNAFSQKIVDFVICHPKTMEPVLLVELDDVMHDFKKDTQRDNVTARAGYQTIRFWSKNKPTVQELKQHIAIEIAIAKGI